MKLWHVKNIEGFFKVVDACKGSVILKGDDIQLNLKSKLAQYFSLAEIFSNGDIPELELEFSEPDDVAAMIKFAISG